MTNTNEVLSTIFDLALSTSEGDNQASINAVNRLAELLGNTESVNYNELTRDFELVRNEQNSDFIDLVSDELLSINVAA